MGFERHAKDFVIYPQVSCNLALGETLYLLKNI
jgi:hypothetical protein